MVYVVGIVILFLPRIVIIVSNTADSFNYLHYGNFTYNVDERAEVAILTRNIFIEGVMEDECYYNNKAEKKLCDKFYRDTFGGHIKVRLPRTVCVWGVGVGGGGGACLRACVYVCVCVCVCVRACVVRVCVCLCV